ncbi:MAG TPA: type VI secretion system contractile sheath small subunit [Longimicrobium sp.]|jgi:type VI secretion system protein ImpB
MAGKESTQHWLDRNRPPRVQITYDVETGGASEKKELPLVVGILADLSGNPQATKLKDRKFVEIDSGNLDSVMKQVAPGLELKDAEGSVVANIPPLTGIDDFSPASLVTKVDGLKELFQLRTDLNDLLAKLDGNDALDERLQKLLASADDVKALSEELAKRAPAPAPEPPAA